MASEVCAELMSMMDKMISNMTKQLQELKEEKIMPITEYMAKFSTTIFSNGDSLQKIEFKLDTMSHNDSKIDYKLNKAEKIYADQQKATNQCITKVESHVQNNKIIHSQFE
eukprot:11088053-Ditylum_brightwellii.AAC.1